MSSSHASILDTRTEITTMTTQTTIDLDCVQGFAGKVLGDLAGTMATVLAILGDRLGLFSAWLLAVQPTAPNSPTATV